MATSRCKAPLQAAVERHAMFEFLAEWIGIGLVFCADVFLLRKIRAARGRPEHALSEDTLDMAVLTWGAVPLVGAGALAVCAVLSFSFDLPLWLSFGGPMLIGGLYCAYKYRELFRLRMAPPPKFPRCLH